MKTEIDIPALIEATIADLRKLGLSESEIEEVLKELSLLDDDNETTK